jgi:branched-chain amino acid aminotransferase
MESGSHTHHKDQRNQTVLVYVNGKIVPRIEARVSVFDSGFLMGDGVWEGLRLHHGGIAFFEDHLTRLFEGADAIDLDIGLSRQALRKAVYDTVEANGMHDGVHLRLMVTRGQKSTPFQGTGVNLGRPTIVVVAEWKEPSAAVIAQGLKLFTVHVRRGRPDVQDPMWNSHSKLNCVTACIQADKAGADEGLMLDPQGFVATCNSTHFFIVRRGELWTSTGNYCLHGVTRQRMLDLAEQQGITAREKNFSLTQVYSADEAFCTGTYSGIIPVREVDGRQIGDGQHGDMTKKLMGLYAEMVREDCLSEVGRT